MNFSITKQIGGKLGWPELRKEVLNYDLSTFKSDFWAGALVAAIAVPSVMAFAMLAQLNPMYGIYSFIIAAIAATFVGVSVYAVVGPTSVMALMIASAFGTLAIPNSDKMGAVLLLTLMVGLIQIALSFFNFSELANYISRSVIVGLVAGVAVIITVSQLTRVLGIEQIHEGNVFVQLYRIGANINNVTLTPLLIAVITIVVVLVVEKVLLAKAPAYLSAIGVSMGLVYFFGLESELRLVGDLRGTFTGLSSLTLDFALAKELFSYSLAIAMLGFLEVVTVSEFNNKGAVNEEKVNKEYLRVGVANTACSLLGGFAGGESFTRSFVNYKAGARTRFSQLIAAVLVLVFVFFFGWLIKLFPLASLGAILILVASDMIDWTEIKKIVRTAQSDVLMFFTTFLAVIFIPRLDYAVYLGILFSLLLLAKDSSNVNYSYLKVGDKEIDQTPSEVAKDENRVIIDLAGDLNFTTAVDLRKRIKKVLQSGITLILRMRNVDDIDMTVIEELEEFINQAKQKDGDIFFTGLSSELQKEFKKAGLIEKLGDDHFFAKEKELFTGSKKAVDKARKDS